MEFFIGLVAFVYLIFPLVLLSRTNALRAQLESLERMLGIVIGLAWRENPMRTGAPVGGPFFNFVLLGYGIPAVLMAVLARIIRNTRPQPFYIIATVTAIVLALCYLTLEVRTLFQGSVLAAPFMSDAEDYTYSAVWLAFGVALLLVGIAASRVSTGHSPSSASAWCRSASAGSTSASCSRAASPALQPDRA